MSLCICLATCFCICVEVQLLDRIPIRLVLQQRMQYSVRVIIIITFLFATFAQLVELAWEWEGCASDLTKKYNVARLVGVELNLAPLVGRLLITVTYLGSRVMGR